jgi:hypothetical protein
MYRPWQDPDDPRCRHLIILPNVARLSQPGAIEACCSIDDEIRVVQDSNMTRRPQPPKKRHGESRRYRVTLSDATACLPPAVRL